MNLPCEAMLSVLPLCLPASAGAFSGNFCFCLCVVGCYPRYGFFICFICELCTALRTPLCCTVEDLRFVPKLLSCDWFLECLTLALREGCWLRGGLAGSSFFLFVLLLGRPCPASAFFALFLLLVFDFGLSGSPSDIWEEAAYCCNTFTLALLS